MTAGSRPIEGPRVEAEIIDALWELIGSGALSLVTPGVERFPYGAASDDRMREFANRYGADPEEIVRIKHQWGEQMAAVPAEPSLVIRRIREWAQDHDIDGDQLVDYWRTRWRHTSSKPPFARPALTSEERGFWRDESAEYELILSKDYEALNPEDLIRIIEEAESFISAPHLRYFAPALAEHVHQVLACGSRAAAPDETIVKALRKALPLQNPREMAEGLRRAISVRKIGPLDRMGMHPGWREIVSLIFELGSGDLVAALLESDESSVAFTVAEYVDAVLGADIPSRPETSLELLIATMERIAALDDHDASLYARVVLGQASREDLATCRDPRRPVHGRR